MFFRSSGAGSGQDSTRFPVGRLAPSKVVYGRGGDLKGHGNGGTGGCQRVPAGVREAAVPGQEYRTCPSCPATSCGVSQEGLRSPAAYREYVLRYLEM